MKNQMNTLTMVCFILFVVQTSAFGNGFSEGNLKHFTVERDLEWATPDGFSLTMDIYTPTTGRDSYPVYIIFHGGGWLINDKSIMDQMSEYMAKEGEYVVANVNYRLLVDQDNSIRMDQIIEDAFGAVLWIKANIAQYKGDPNRVAVSGDSAGGHLAAMVVNSGPRLAENGFMENAEGFRPSYFPADYSLEEAQEAMEVQAAVLNYPALNIHASALGGFEKPSNMLWQMGGVEARGIFGQEITVESKPGHYRGVSPWYNIPDASERKLPPQLITVGSEDDLILPEMVKEYVEMLKEAGHPVEYWEHEGRPHAYLDSGTNEMLGISFEKDAPEAIDKIIDFLDKLFRH